MVEILFEDIFTVTQLDPDGKKFDKVSRVEAVSQQFNMQMQLDVNTKIYPLSVGEKFTMVLAPTLNLDGTPDTGYFIQVAGISNKAILEGGSDDEGASTEAQGRDIIEVLGREKRNEVLAAVYMVHTDVSLSVRQAAVHVWKTIVANTPKTLKEIMSVLMNTLISSLASSSSERRQVTGRSPGKLGERVLPAIIPILSKGLKDPSTSRRQVAGISDKDILEGGSDDEGASTEAQGRAITEVLGREKRNEVLAAVYMVRTDVSLSVRQATVHVWKTIVANTPKTLKEIMPVLMNTLISSLASSSSERRQVAGRSLGKLGERVLPAIIPILSKGLKDPSTSRRQGVCIGLSEVMGSAGKHQLLSFMDELIPTIRTALCDSTPEVRESAGLAFSTLYKSAGMQAIDEIVPTLLRALEDDETSDTALDGLKQILSVRTSAVLPHILPKLVIPPLSAFNAHAIGALAEVAGPGLDSHIGTILPALLIAMGDDDMDVQHSAKKAAETVVLVIDEEGIDSLISELTKGVTDNQALLRRGSAYLLGYFFKNSKLYLVDEAPSMISTLITLLSDTDSATVAIAWEALGRVVVSVPKEVLSSYIKLVRDAVSTARDKERRKRKGGSVLIPGFCLPKALQPVLPIFLQGLTSGSAETREQAALGLGELIDVTSEKTLKEFVVPITGPLIRIIGDRFPWQVKAAILSTLSIIISKGGIALKPFLPQLQTTFIKCLQDNTRTIRTSAALALGKLSALSTRVDPLVGDLLSTLQASDGGVRQAVLTALKGVMKHAGKSVSSTVRSRASILLKDMLQLDDDEVRSSAAKVIGTMSQYMEEDEFSDLLQSLSDSSTTSNWFIRHGSLLTLASMSVHCSTMICQSPLFPSLVNHLKDALKDDKFPIREAATKALGRLLSYQAQYKKETENSSELLRLLVSALLDDSSEVRRRSLSSIKKAAKGNPLVVTSNLQVLGPALAECLKDGNTPVRLAAERCALHVFQLTKGPEYVQGAQKYISGLDARRLAKLSENSDESDNSEDDTAIV